MATANLKVTSKPNHTRTAASRQGRNTGSREKALGGTATVGSLVPPPNSFTRSPNLTFQAKGGLWAQGPRRRDLKHQINTEIH